MFNFSTRVYVQWLLIVNMVLGAIAVPLAAVARSQNVQPPAARHQARSQVRRQVRRRPRPPRRLPPNRVQPGGGLDVAAQSCDSSRQPLTALVPVENPVFTASAYPTFLFHLTDDPDQIERAEFMLLDADEKEQIYAMQFEPTQAGIVSISLPAEAAYALEPEQAYHWYLNIHCKRSTAVLSVDGWVQRLGEAESIEARDESGLPVVWYDAIAQVATELAVSSQATSQQEWAALLAAVGLESAAAAPIAGTAISLE